MAQDETSIRTALGIPTTAKRVLIISQSSHMDWDWLESFPVLYDVPQAPYFNGNNATAQSIISQAAGLLAKNGGAGPQYYYSLAEIGFLERFYEKGPKTDVKTLDAAAKAGFFHLVGGGITSPDSLLSHGECFIRNSLVAQDWVRKTMPANVAVENLWIPDDFGHDSQLPATVEAMGLRGAGFERIPGGQFQQPGVRPVNGSPSMACELQNRGIDFYWIADDGSQMLGHYLVGGYGQSANSQGSLNYIGGTAGIAGYLALNERSSPTPYIFVPAGSDFNAPATDMLSSVNAWNAGTGPDSYNGTGVYAVCATFDHYVALVEAHGQNLDVRRFGGNPVWVGTYGSRPALKRWQYDVTRRSMSTEVIGTIAQTLGIKVAIDWQKLLFDSWSLNVASTHHDYIVGTAADFNPQNFNWDAGYMDVYGIEQLTRLMLAGDKATIAQEAVMLALCEAITPAQQATSRYAGSSIPVSAVTSETPIAVFNTLGFERTGLAILPRGADYSTLDVRNSVPGAQGGGLVQPTHDGDMLFMAKVPSLGYDTSYLNGNGGTDFPKTASNLSISTPDNGQSYVLENDLVSVTIAASANWGITSLQDRTSKAELILTGKTANDLVFYADNGSIYRYGNEPSGSGTTMAIDPKACLTPMGALVVEDGPLRVKLDTMVKASVAGNTFTYKRTYALELGAAHVEMTCAGKAPSGPGQMDGYSVMAAFPLTAPVGNRIAYGTPNHWTSAPMVQSWDAPNFVPSHNFVMPLETSGTPICGVYHDAMPAWGYDGFGALIGNLFRNNPDSANRLGAQATDRGIHLQRYAIRVPSGLGQPETGQPLREALAFQTPLAARPVSNLSSNTAPATYALAALDPQAKGILTVAKPAQDQTPQRAVLRIYQPTNGTEAETLTFGSKATSPTGLTALEGALSAEATQRLNLAQPSASTVTFDATRALTTIGVTLS